MSGFGAESLLIEVVSVINHHVSSLALLDLSASDGTLCCTGNMVGRCFPKWQAADVSNCLNWDSFDWGDFGDCGG